jgi:hypothetical protein
MVVEISAGTMRKKVGFCPDWRQRAVFVQVQTLWHYRGGWR